MPLTRANAHRRAAEFHPDPGCAENLGSNAAAIAAGIVSADWRVRER
ncbi:MAG: hypothetical protein M3O70_05700 [Actinomycetota bacterium]|nr:hypothetical protein [Actinomycetota bacterium]